MKDIFKQELHAIKQMPSPKLNGPLFYSLIDSSQLNALLF